MGYTDPNALLWNEKFSSHAIPRKYGGGGRGGGRGGDRGGGSGGGREEQKRRKEGKERRRAWNTLSKDREDNKAGQKAAQKPRLSKQNFGQMSLSLSNASV